MIKPIDIGLDAAAFSAMAVALIGGAVFMRVIGEAALSRPEIRGFYHFIALNFKKRGVFRNSRIKRYKADCLERHTIVLIYYQRSVTGRGIEKSI